MSNCPKCKSTDTIELDNFYSYVNGIETTMRRCRKCGKTFEVKIDVGHRWEEDDDDDQASGRRYVG